MNYEAEMSLRYFFFKKVYTYAYVGTLYLQISLNLIH